MSRAEPRTRTGRRARSIQRDVDGIFLGFPFDQLLNQRNPYVALTREQGNADSNSDKDIKPGIVLPNLQKRKPGVTERDPNGRRRDPGTGNIVITGTPGTGKSTLALQIAVDCARRDENRCIPLYIALENSPDEIACKARPFGWQEFVRPLYHPHPGEYSATPETLANSLRSILTQERDACSVQRAEANEDACKAHRKRIADMGTQVSGLSPQVVVASLSPRPLVEGETDTPIFWRRYRQIEHLLEAAAHLRAETKEAWRWRAIFPVVVVDSLNMIAMRELTREELYRLFMLFRHYETIGIFVVESGDAVPFDSTLADVVISLTGKEDNGYFVRYLEVQKSRYRNQVYGRHPFKIVPLKGADGSEGTASTALDEVAKAALEGRRESRAAKVASGAVAVSADHNAFVGVTDTDHHDEGVAGEEAAYRTPGIPGRHGPQEERGDLPRHGVVVFPSLHYVVLKTGRGESEGKGSRRENWRSPELRWGIKAMARVFPRGMNDGSTIAIEGPRGTFKTNLAMSFLAAGLRSGEGESGILVRLHDHPMLSGAATSWPPLSGDLVRGEKPVTWSDFHSLEERDPVLARRWQLLASPEKALITVWTHAKGSLFEVDFKGGSLLPEEVVQILWEIILRKQESEHPIRRIVLDDVSEIGTAYPFLRRSSTSGDIFLAALAHVMRNHGIDMVVTGTTGDLRAVDDIVGAMCSVADVVLSTRFCSIFGERDVILRGEGLTAHDHGSPSAGNAVVPPVIRNSGKVHGQRTFTVLPHRLEGLVGFESDKVERPGLTMHVFEQPGHSHAKYHRELRLMFGAAMGADDVQSRPQNGLIEGTASEPDVTDAGAGNGQAQDANGGSTREKPNAAQTEGRSLDRIAVVAQRNTISILPFSSSDSEAIHDSLCVFHESEPIDRTVIYTVDEFWQSERSPGVQLEDRFIKVDAPWLDKDDKDDRLMAKGFTKGGLSIADEQSVWPYYLNVLFLAYRRDVFHGRLKHRLTWRRLRDIARGASQEVPKGHPPLRFRFWHDRSSPETLSCALLDAILSGRHRAALSRGHKITVGQMERLLCPAQENMTGQERTEVAALRDLLWLSHDRSCCNERPTRDDDVLPANSAIYLCWYSQLRELLYRKPDLATKIDVCALPAGGFSGDWYVGIVKGSVSPSLGRTVLEMLCRKSEEYKRFARGVGLPVREAFNGEAFYAWPRGSHIWLSKVLEIHKRSLSRNSIPRYADIRSTLATVAMQLAPPRHGVISKRPTVTVQNTVPRLYKQLKRLGFDASAKPCASPSQPGSDDAHK